MPYLVLKPPTTEEYLLCKLSNLARQLLTSQWNTFSLNSLLAELFIQCNTEGTTASLM